MFEILEKNIQKFIWYIKMKIEKICDFNQFVQVLYADEKNFFGVYLYKRFYAEYLSDEISYTTNFCDKKGFFNINGLYKKLYGL